MTFSNVLERGTFHSVIRLSMVRVKGYKVPINMVLSVIYSILRSYVLLDDTVK